MLKALDREPSNRYQKRRGLRGRYQALLARVPIQALPPRITDRLHKFVLRNRSAVTIAAMAFAAIIVTVGYTIHRETATRATTAASAAALPERSVAVPSCSSI